MVKQEKVKKACQITDLAFTYILPKIKLDISEIKLAKEIEGFMKGSGAGIAFPTIVAFGDHTSSVHHPTGRRVLKGRGVFIMLDFGARYKNYCSDMTRTLFLGEASSKQKEIYKIVLKAQQKALRYIKDQLKTGNQIKVAEVDMKARQYILDKGFPTIPHSVGHGVGKKVHEKPKISYKSREILKKGIPFTIEPGIYIKGFGGVRIEDVYVIEGNKVKQLTKSPKELIEI